MYMCYMHLEWCIKYCIVLFVVRNTVARLWGLKLSKHKYIRDKWWDKEALCFLTSFDVSVVPLATKWSNNWCQILTFLTKNQNQKPRPLTILLEHIQGGVVIREWLMKVDEILHTQRKHNGQHYFISHYQTNEIDRMDQIRPTICL